MGVSLTELIEPKPIKLDELQGKIVAIDAFNFLYQFLTTLRSPDGSLLTDSQGRVTSHLIGLFSRTTRLMQKNIKLVYVFDGEPPKLKQNEIDRRKKLKLQAQKEYEIAKESEDSESMKKYASRTVSLTSDMIDDAKALIDALGIPIIQAPSEGEAQAAFMQQKGDIDFVATQDTDALLFGAPQVIKNLSFAGKKKKISKLSYETIGPELITVSDMLTQLDINQTQLICLGMLVGTDFNVGGVKGLGPKKGLKLVKEFPNPHDLFTHLQVEFPWQDIIEIFQNIPTTSDYALKWRGVDKQRVIEVLVDKHEFSLTRVQSTLDNFSEHTQTGLGNFM